MQGAGGADAEDLEGPVLRLDLTGEEVHVRQGVELGHDDIDVVGADTVGEGRQALAVVAAGHRNELTGGMAEFDVAQVFRNHIDTAGVSDHDNGVSQLFRLDMEMEHGTVRVDDQFRLRDTHCQCH